MNMRFSVGNLNLDIDQEAGTIEFQSSRFQETSLTSQISAQCQSNGRPIELIPQSWTIKRVNMDELSRMYARSIRFPSSRMFPGQE